VVPKTLEGPLNDRVDTGQEEPGGQLNATFADRGARVSVITERGFQRSRTLNSSRRLAWQLSADLGMTPHGRSALKKLSLEGESIETTLQNLMTHPPATTRRPRD